MNLLDACDSAISIHLTQTGKPVFITTIDEIDKIYFAINFPFLVEDIYNNYIKMGETDWNIYICSWMYNHIHNNILKKFETNISLCVNQYNDIKRNITIKPLCTEFSPDDFRRKDWKIFPTDTSKLSINHFLAESKEKNLLDDIIKEFEYLIQLNNLKQNCQQEPSNSSKNNSISEIFNKIVYQIHPSRVNSLDSYIVFKKEIEKLLQK